MRLIDADALKYEPLPKGDRNYRTYNLDDAYDDGYDDAFVDIRNAPTVDAEPVRHGRWTADETLYTQGMVACSCCKTEYYRDDLDMIMPKYCPHCGARMDVMRRNPLEKVDRNIEIYESRKRGEGFTEISKKFNITPQRARQIFNKEARIRLWKRKWGVERDEG